jgi:hypothetical protein
MKPVLSLSKLYAVLFFFLTITAGANANAAGKIQCTGTYSEEDAVSLRTVNIVFEPQVGGAVNTEDYHQRDFSDPELGNFRGTFSVSAIEPVKNPLDGLKVSYIRSGSSDGAGWTITDYFYIAKDFKSGLALPNANEAKLKCNAL